MYIYIFMSSTRSSTIFELASSFLVSHRWSLGERDQFLSESKSHRLEPQSERRWRPFRPSAGRESQRESVRSHGIFTSKPWWTL